MSTQTITITPQYVNVPKPGKKYGTLKTADGISYAAGPHVTSQCQPGVPVTIEWEGQKWGDSPVMVVTRVVGQNGTQAPQQGMHAPPHQQAPHPAESYPAHSNAQPNPRPPITWTDRQIFVLGLAQRTMQTGQFSIAEIQTIVLACDAAFDALLQKHNRH